MDKRLKLFNFAESFSPYAYLWFHETRYLLLEIKMNNAISFFSALPVSSNIVLNATISLVIQVSWHSCCKLA